MFIRSLVVTGFVVTVALSMGKDVAALHQEMTSSLEKLGSSAIQFECSVQTQIVEPTAQVKERFPDGTVSYTLPGRMSVDSSGATSPLVMGGGRLTEDGRVALKGENDLKVSRAGKLYLLEQTMTTRDGDKVVNHRFSNGSSSKALVEKFTSEGVQRNGSEPARPGPASFVPQYSRVYQISDPAAFNDSQVSEVSENTVKLSMTDSKGSVEYHVDTILGVIKKATITGDGPTMERTYSDFVKVGDFNLPGSFTETEMDSEGKLLRKIKVTNCRYKLLTPEDVEATLKLDFPEGTEMSQRGMAMPAPGL